MNNIYFPELTFNEPGVYFYTIKEHDTGGKSKTGEIGAEWITDKRVYRVTITVTDDGEGNLSAAVEYPDGEPVFINIACKKRRCRCFYICCCYCRCCCCCRNK